MNFQTLPGLFISHGSPMLALDPEQVGPALHRLSSNLPKPQAIIVMSAHRHVPKHGMTFVVFHLHFMRFATRQLAHRNWQKKY